ncbi:MAG: HAMP domain-containing histidine kinase [Chitinophagaceae bacterium]|nr:HAMP domain-containing histidine kinase [Anaerolineae bacterium]
MMTSPALQEAQDQLNALIEAARKGAIIPVRLTGQLEAIATFLVQAAEEQKTADATPKPSGDVETVMHDNTEFLKTAVHELRTPMTSIRGYSDMLSNPGMAGALSEMQNQLLQVIRTNSKRMEGLLADMSYINKIRGDALRPNAKMDMFKNIALMAEKQTRPIAEELNRQLEFDIPQGLPLMTTDGELLSLALTKLIENGLRYSPEGEGKVIVKGATEGNNLIVTVSDNGVGITPDEIAQLGTLYFRSDHDAIRAYKGSGLGIPIVYGVVKILDGEINVTSEPDQGTVFTLKFHGMT